VQYFEDALRGQPFREMASRLRSELSAADPGLRAITEGAAGTPRAAGKWTPKEILGHLIDSAANNHQRFVRAEEGQTLRLPGYAQDRWVAAQAYDARSWADLVDFFSAYNLHLAHVLERLPESRRDASCEIGGGPPVSLSFVALDYIGHLQHHLKQILDFVGRGQAT
jgi:hypothetical protein